MREMAYRLREGDDLKQFIEDVCKNSDTVVVLSAVGSLKKVKIRLANAKDYLEETQNYEIVSLTGTISHGKAHLHISFADEKGNVFGGHLEKGCIIYTTCELVLYELEDYSSIRDFDPQTGYKEIIFEKK